MKAKNSELPESAPRLAALVASLGAALGVTSVVVHAAEPAPVDAASVKSEAVRATVRQQKDSPTVQATATQDKLRPLDGPTVSVPAATVDANATCCKHKVTTRGVEPETAPIKKTEPKPHPLPEKATPTAEAKAADAAAQQ